MKRQNISINQMQNGKYQASYRDPYTQKRMRKRFETYKEAKEFESQIKNMFKNSSNEHLQTLKINELMQLHIEKCPNTKVDSRRISYESFLDTFGEIELRHFSTVEVKNWLDQLRSKYNWAEITVAHIKGSLNHFFNFLIDEGVISKSPLESYRINRNAPPKKARIFLTADEIKLLLDHAKIYSPHFLHPFLLGLVHTGARRQEIINLEWKDVDLINNILHIKDIKSGAARPIKISPTLKKCIENLPRVAKNVFINPINEKIG
jgi:integrase